MARKAGLFVATIGIVSVTPGASNVVPQEARILTHCNAGALATAGYGTALGVIRGAVEAGKSVTVLADEIGQEPVPSLLVDKVVRTTCSPNCTGSCGQLAFVRDGHIVCKGAPVGTLQRTWLVETSPRPPVLTAR